MPGMATFSSTMAPFLYRTRTIQRQSLLLSRQSARSLSGKRTPLATSGDDIDVDAAFMQHFAGLEERSPKPSRQKSNWQPSKRGGRRETPGTWGRRQMQDNWGDRQEPDVKWTSLDTSLGLGLDSAAPTPSSAKPATAPSFTSRNFEEPTSELHTTDTSPRPGDLLYDPSPPKHRPQLRRDQLHALENRKESRRRQFNQPQEGQVQLNGWTRPDPEEDPWWQVARVQDPAIAQPPVMEFRPVSGGQEPPQFKVSTDPVKNKANVEQTTDAEKTAGAGKTADTKTERDNDDSDQAVVTLESQAETTMQGIVEEHEPKPEAPSEADLDAAYLAAHPEAYTDADTWDDDLGIEDAGQSDKRDVMPGSDSDLEWVTTPEKKTSPRPERRPSWFGNNSDDGPWKLSTPYDRRSPRTAPRTGPNDNVPWDASSLAVFSPSDNSTEVLIPFDFQSNSDGQNRDGEADDMLDSDRSPLSTLTKQEMATFAQIWNEIVVFNHKPQVRLPDPSSPSAQNLLGTPKAAADIPPTATAVVDAEKEKAAEGQSAVKFLIKDAVYAARQQDVTNETVVDQMRNARYRKSVLQQYPTSVREVAVKALGLHRVPQQQSGQSQLGSLKASDDRGSDAVLHRIKSMGVVDQRVEEQRQKEWTRLKDLLTNTQTDRDLWDVLEEHVFSIPARLGIEETMEKQDPKSAGLPDVTVRGDGGSVIASAGDEAKPSRTRSSSSSSSSRSASSSLYLSNNSNGDVTETESEYLATDTGEQSKITNDDSRAMKKSKIRLQMDVYGPVYPALLIAAHRQLVHNFAPPSPLAFQLLPRIKSLGLASYVLGASTTLYNETISLWWTHRGDLRAVLSILDEMDAAGLYADSHTEKLLDRINTTLKVCEGGTCGFSGFVPSMMRMGGFAAGIRRRVAAAHARVRESVVQRGVDLLT